MEHMDEKLIKDGVRMQFDSWIESKIYLVDAERYANMHWKDIGDDLKIRHEMAVRDEALLVVRFDYKHVKSKIGTGRLVSELVPYSMAILQHADAVVSYDEEESRWFVAKNRYHDLRYWKGSDKDLSMKLDNHMMEMIAC
jgi:hypothetical protein